MRIWFIFWAPYHLYKSLKREKLSHKLAGITSTMMAILILVTTHPPINLPYDKAFGLLGTGVSLELFYVAYKQKNIFLYMAGGVVGILGFILFFIPLI